MAGATVRLKLPLRHFEHLLAIVDAWAEDPDITIAEKLRRLRWRERALFGRDIQ